MMNLKNTLTKGMTDSHLHLAIMEKKGLDPEKILDECVNSGLTYFLDINTKIGPFMLQGKEDSYPGLLRATGIFPTDAGSPDEEKRLADLENLLINTPKIAALGEIGLDYYWSPETADAQKELFVRQIKLANDLNLPIIIHCREAENDLIEIIKEHTPKAHGILHCFSGTKEGALELIKYGLYISFAGNITYKKNEALREVVKEIPDDCLLLETDAPFLTPEPFRGKINHPGLIGLTYQVIAEIRGCAVEHLVNNVGKNFSRLFKNSIKY